MTAGERVRDQESPVSTDQVAFEAQKRFLASAQHRGQ